MAFMGSTLSRKSLPVVLLAAVLTASAAGQTIAVTIDAGNTRAPISPYIYGQFIEHLGRCIYGGIWAEMLEDRKFYFPVPADLMSGECSPT